MEGIATRGTSFKYMIDGKQVSQARYFDYHMDNFDWVLVYDVETDEQHQNKGYATKLLEKIIEETEKEGMSLYLFCRIENKNAIKLYEKLGFSILKDYEMKDGMYHIMVRGDADKDQFVDMDFSDM
jgi:ribosomal protein S18 acetylase RimI-like enzyme